MLSRSLTRLPSSWGLDWFHFQTKNNILNVRVEEKYKSAYGSLKRNRGKFKAQHGLVFFAKFRLLCGFKKWKFVCYLSLLTSAEWSGWCSVSRQCSTWPALRGERLHRGFRVLGGRRRPTFPSKPARTAPRPPAPSTAWASRPSERNYHHGQLHYSLLLVKWCVGQLVISCGAYQCPVITLLIKELNQRHYQKKTNQL